LYGCESWTLTFRKEHKLRVLKNRVLRKITGPKRKEIAGQLHRIALSGAS
jgi:hypothetical protein